MAKSIISFTDILLYIQFYLLLIPGVRLLSYCNTLQQTFITCHTSVFISFKVYMPPIINNEPWITQETTMTDKRKKNGKKEATFKPPQ